MAHSFLVHFPDDVVGVAVTDIEPGPDVPGKIQTSGDVATLEVRDRVPLGHKVALRDLEAGERVIKYGVPIGVATRDIRAGEHVA